MQYVIWDTRDRCVVGGTYKSRQRAQRKADFLDSLYGAVRYVVKIDANSPQYR